MLMLHALFDKLDLRSISEGGYGVDDYLLLKKWLKKMSAREVGGCA
jgi:hypothetical protein